MLWVLYLFPTLRPVRTAYLSRSFTWPPLGFILSPRYKYIRGFDPLHIQMMYLTLLASYWSHTHTYIEPYVGTSCTIISNVSTPHHPKDPPQGPFYQEGHGYNPTRVPRWREMGLSHPTPLKRPIGCLLVGIISPGFRLFIDLHVHMASNPEDHSQSSLGNIPWPPRPLGHKIDHFQKSSPNDTN